MDRVSGEAAAARIPQRRSDRFRPGGRGASDLRAGSRRQYRIRRLRTGLAEERSDPVPKDSPIKTVADLKGKRVALNKGSNVNYLIVKALEANGLTYGDIVPAYLAPADARAAFERGSVDAWVIWDPYYAAAELSLGARSIADGTGLAPNVSFYMASRQVAEGNTEVLKAVLAAVDEIDVWIRDNRKQYAIELAPKVGLPVEVIERGVNRAEIGAHPIDAATLEGQQKIADAFADLKLIPKPLRVTDAAWKVGE
jgi:sulfonate transport system substrate-binding protein